MRYVCYFFGTSGRIDQEGRDLTPTRVGTVTTTTTTTTTLVCGRAHSVGYYIILTG